MINKFNILNNLLSKINNINYNSKIVWLIYSLLIIVISILIYNLVSINKNDNFENKNKDENKDIDNIIDEKIKKLTKQDCELVIARYNEDVSWSKPYAHLRTIYNKGNDDLGEEYQPIIKLPNVGTEIHTILEHIIRNYDNLANNTIFLQGNISDRSCRDTISLDNFFHSNDDDLLGCNSKIDVNSDWHHPPTYNNRKLEPCQHNIGDFFKKVLNIDFKSDMNVIYQSQIAVGKKRILKHPKEYYMNILYNKTNLAKVIFPEEGHFMERAWVAIFS